MERWLQARGFDVLFFLLWLGARLPARMQYFCAGRIGWLARILIPKRRRVADRNLELCFPEYDEEQRQALLCAHFHALGMSLFEIAMAWYARDERIARSCEVRGLEHVEAARRAGHGVLILSGHFTVMELFGRAGCSFVEAALLYRAHRQQELEERVLDLRRGYGAIPLRRRDLRTALRHMRRGGVLWYAFDQNYDPKHSRFVPFFGIDTATITAPLSMARAAKAKILTVRQYRAAPGRYVFELSTPWENLPSGDDAADLAALNAELEAQVRAHPDQYFWVHRRFKSAPPGAAPRYP